MPSLARGLPAVGIMWVSFTACGGPLAPTPSPSPPSLPNVIEGLLLGSGPVGQGDCGPEPGVWHSFPRGATVRLILASTIDAEGRRTLEQAVADVVRVINGRFALVVEPVDEPDPFPLELQITSSDVPDARIRATCSAGASGCTRIEARAGPLYLSARAIQRVGTSPRLKVHEFGHALGLCHVDRDRIPDAAMAESPGNAAQPRFSTLELDALRAVYASGLEPGATRDDFRRVGLVP